MLGNVLDRAFYWPVAKQFVELARLSLVSGGVEKSYLGFDFSTYVVRGVGD